MLVKCLLNPYHELKKSHFHRFTSLVSMLILMQWYKCQCHNSQVSIHQPLQGFKKERCETDGSIIPRSIVGIRTGLRYKHNFNLSPCGWNVARRQAGTKYSDKVCDDTFPCLLQQGREYAIHSWTLVWGKGIYCPFYPSVDDYSHRQPPVRTSCREGGRWDC